MYTIPEPDQIVHKILKNPYVAHLPRNNQQLDAIIEKLQQRLGEHGLTGEEAQRLGRYLEGVDAPARIRLAVDAYELGMASGEGAVETMDAIRNEPATWTHVQGAIQIKDMLRDIEQGELILDLDHFNGLSRQEQAAINEITHSVSGLIDRMWRAYENTKQATSQKKDQQEAVELAREGKEELLPLLELMRDIAAQKENINLEAVSEKVENIEIGIDEYIIEMRSIQTQQESGRTR